MADFLDLPDLPPPTESPQEIAEDIYYRNEMLRATEKIIEDKFVERHLDKFPLWSIASKSYKLTFFEERDVNIQENLFEAEVCRMLRSIPPCHHSPDLYLQIGQARMIFHTNLRRSLGTINRDKINERIALLSQIKQIISTGGSGGGSSSGGIGGMFRRLVGR